MNIISRNANNVRMEDGRIVYEVSAMLESVEANGCEAYIMFISGECYSLSLSDIKNAIDGIDMDVTVQVSIDTTGKIEAKYLGINEQK